MSKTVLAVDDDPQIADKLASLIESRGLSAVKAHDGLSALKIIRTQKIDLVTLDLVMPKLDGFKCARLFKFDERFAHIPVIAISHLSLKNVAEVAKGIGFEAFVQKPIKDQDFFKALDTVIARMEEQ